MQTKIIISKFIIAICVFLFFISCTKEKSKSNISINNTDSLEILMQSIPVALIRTDQTMYIHTGRDIISHRKDNKTMSSRMTYQEIDSLIENLLHEPINTKKYVPHDFSLHRSIYGYGKKDSIYFIFYGEDIMHDYETIFLATFKNNKLISKIQLGHTAMNLSEIHCSTIFPDLTISKCLSYMYPLKKQKRIEKTLFKEYYKINEDGKIMLQKSERLHLTPENQCKCRNMVDSSLVLFYENRMRTHFK